MQLFVQYFAPESLEERFASDDSGVFNVNAIEGITRLSRRELIIGSATLIVGVLSGSMVVSLIASRACARRDQTAAEELQRHNTALAEVRVAKVRLASEMATVSSECEQLRKSLARSERLLKRTTNECSNVKESLAQARDERDNLRISIKKANKERDAARVGLKQVPASPVPRNSFTKDATVTGKDGLTEEQRFKYFSEVQAGFRANVKTAESKFGVEVGSGFDEYLEQLDSATVSALRVEYGISREQSNDILVREAIEKGWFKRLPK